MREALANVSVRPVYMTSNADLKLGTYVYGVGCLVSSLYFYLI